MMTLAISIVSYMLLGLTVMNIGLHRAFNLTPDQRAAIMWWSWFWPYMGVRWVVVRILSWK